MPGIAPCAISAQESKAAGRGRPIRQDLADKIPFLLTRDSRSNPAIKDFVWRLRKNGADNWE